MTGGGVAHAKAPRIEWSGPEHARAGVLVLHGGAWRLTGPGALRSLRPAAERFAALGVRVANADYRPGATSLVDARRALRRLRARLPPPARVCLYGESAGGQLALVLAAHDRAVRCVLTVGAVADLTRLRRDHAGAAVVKLARRTWGREPGGLRAYSPLTFARRLDAPVLLAGLRDDPIVPSVQQRRLAARLPDARVMLVSGGDAAFVHGGASSGGVRAVARTQERLLRRALGLRG
jgi:acetyl esterase/lipase